MRWAISTGWLIWAHIFFSRDQMNEMLLSLLDITFVDRALLVGFSNTNHLNSRFNELLNQTIIIDWCYFGCWICWMRFMQCSSVINSTWQMHDSFAFMLVKCPIGITSQADATIPIVFDFALIPTLYLNPFIIRIGCFKNNYFFRHFRVVSPQHIRIYTHMCVDFLFN